MTCPHCSKRINDSNHDFARRNAECYGSGVSTFLCKHCNKKYSFYIQVKTEICNIAKEEDAAELSY